MCLAIPAKITAIKEDMAVVNVGGAMRQASLMLVSDPLSVGDYVIVHAGFALHKMDPHEAEECLRMLRELVDRTRPGD